MPTYDYGSVKAKCGALVSEALKLLLETKHLYQYVPVRFIETIDEMHPNTLEYGAARREVFKAVNGKWHAVKVGFGSQFQLSEVQKLKGDYITFTTPRLRLYCAVCKRLELHDCTNAQNDDTSFFLVYNCLGCRGARITFLVERRARIASDRLRLAGRYPMEHVAPPASLPPFLEDYYSNAVIAFDCGFVRMGIFGLRTLIEQWGRAATGIATKVDGSELFDQCAALLPSPFNSLYPSLGALYSDLSADIHGAIGDSALFERGQKEIESHFGALHSLGNLSPAILSLLSRKEPPELRVAKEKSPGDPGDGDGISP